MKTIIWKRDLRILFIYSFLSANLTDYTVMMMIFLDYSIWYEHLSARKTAPFMILRINENIELLFLFFTNNTNVMNKQNQKKNQQTSMFNNLFCLRFHENCDARVDKWTHEIDIKCHALSFKLMLHFIIFGKSNKISHFTKYSFWLSTRRSSLRSQRKCMGSAYFYWDLTCNPVEWLNQWSMCPLFLNDEKMLPTTIVKLAEMSSKNKFR